MMSMTSLPRANSPKTDVPTAVADLDRWVNTLQLSIAGLRIAAPLADDDLAGLADVAQEIRDRVVGLRVKLDA
jgi:hypothetical protein